MRVLHLIDAASPQASSSTLAMLADTWDRQKEIEQQAVLLGGETLVAAAESVGLRDTHILGVPFGHAAWGWPALRRKLKGFGQFDLVHCWSLGALSMATVMMRGTARLLTITQPLTKSSVNWLRILAREARGRTLLLPISNTIRRELVSGGVPEKAVVVLRPGIDMSRIDFDARAGLRRTWGIEESGYAVALLCDPATAGDAITGITTVGLAAETLDGPDTRICLIVHPDQRRRRRAELIVQQTTRPYRIVQEPRISQPWLVMPGCDVALAQGPYAGGLSLLWAMAANVPVVGEATYALSEVLEDRHSALLAKPGQRNDLAHRIECLFKDQSLSWRLRDMARHEAYSFFSRQRYSQSLQGIYEQLYAGYEVHVPPLEPTGGLRFSGRA